ncbi:glycosyltransferase [Bifidobacterium samirii]|uniref:Glycosyltransferase n=1 Tax=Bifidobacterium samirii TaxID=2306974 RepID=A0A430FU61_9BIFI|nr:glycosyltransferase [Bifidobacterium samirii]RSX56687.1 glycosyltransferase [Bifidobacterium samirii]
MNAGSTPVTVIVPVHQSAGTLDACLTSVTAQTHRDLRIVVIDDGSTDGGGALCDRWAERDPRILPIHRPHGGVSAARNTGLDAADGDYIAFVDADDTIAPTMIETLLDAAIAGDCRMTMCGIRNIRRAADGPHTAGTHTMRMPATAGNAELVARLPELIRTCHYAPVWNTLYERAFLERCHARFDETIILGEDKLFNTRLYAAADHVACLDEPLYDYTCDTTDAALAARTGERWYRDGRRVRDAIMPYLAAWGDDLAAWGDSTWIHQIGMALERAYAERGDDAKHARAALIRDIAADADAAAAARHIGDARPSIRATAMLVAAGRARPLACYGRSRAAARRLLHLLRRR